MKLLRSEIENGRPNWDLNTLQSSLNKVRSQRKKFDDDFNASRDYVGKCKNWIVGLRKNPNSVKDLPAGFRNSADKIGAISADIEKHQTNMRNISPKIFDSDISIKFLEDKIADVQNSKNVDANTFNQNLINKATLLESRITDITDQSNKILSIYQPFVDAYGGLFRAISSHFYGGCCGFPAAGVNTGAGSGVGGAVGGVLNILSPLFTVKEDLLNNYFGTIFGKGAKLGFGNTGKTSNIKSVQTFNFGPWDIFNHDWINIFGLPSSTEHFVNKNYYRYNQDFVC